MSKAIIYCERCGRIIPPGEMGRGKAVVLENVGVCPECVASLSGRELEEIGRRSSGEAAPAPGGGRGAAATARGPRASRRTDVAPARRLAGRRSRAGITVAVIAAGALAVVAVALVGASGPREEPGGSPEVGAGSRSPPADPGDLPDAGAVAARRRLDEIRTMIDPSLGRYAEVRAALLEFTDECDAPSCSTEAKELLGKIDADFGAMADEELQEAAASAEALASEGKPVEAREVLDEVRERFAGSKWFEERGEKAIAGAFGKIDAARVEAVKAALGRAGEAIESKRFDEARAALEPRATWPEELRARAEGLLAEIGEAEAKLEARDSLKDAWAAFLLGFVDAGKLGLREAKAFLERERQALADLGPDGDVERKLERIERRFREVRLVEDLAEVGVRGARGTVRFTLNGERVGGKVRGVEDGVVRLVTTRGRDVSVPISRLPGADVVRYSQMMRQGSKEKLRAAAYLLLRGDPAAARKATGDATGDAAWALGEQIDEFAKAIEAREARLAAAAKAVEDARAAAREKAAAKADEDRKAEEAKRRAEAAEQGLVLHWEFDRPTRGGVRDSSGKGNHGAVMGATWTAKGRLGGALVFDGGDDYVSVPRPLPVDFSRAFTVCLWAKLDSVSRFDPLIGVTRDGNNYAFCLCVEGGLRLYTKAGGAFDATGVHSTRIGPGVWYHVAAVMDMNNNCTIYVNGAGETSRHVTRRNNQGLLHIARMANAGAWTEKIDGLIDDVRVYDRALSEEEVEFVYGLAPAPGAPGKAAAGGRLPGADAARTPAAPGAGAPRGKLVGNGGFEERDARGFAAEWTREQWGARGAAGSVRLDRSDPRTGERALVVRGMAEGARPGASTSVRLDPGDYEVRYWACADVGKTATVGVRFAGKDLPGRSAVDQWKQFTETITVEKRYLSSRLGFWVSTPGVRTWFDDVELVRK